MANENRPPRKGRRKSRDYKRREEREPVDVRENWNPTTTVGKQVKAGEITDINQLFDAGLPILESEIVDVLLPGLQEDLLLIGQAKGKFGGGQRRIFRQTQKKTREGNKIKFMTCAVVGNKDGYVGVATGKSKETVPARDKAKRKARLNLIRVRRGCGSWECGCGGNHTIPFKVYGKCGSSEIILIPAPKGVGLCVEKQCKKLLQLAGLKDVYSKTKGQTKSKINLMTACFNALKKLSRTKIHPDYIEIGGVIEGRLKDGK